MRRFRRTTSFLSNSLWWLMKKLNRRVSRLYQARAKLGNRILLLTTIGRKSGLRRITPLQYEEVEGIIFVAAARGQKADWFRNVVANPEVEVQLGANRHNAFAEPITVPGRIADFLEIRLQRQPWMMRAMFLMHGLLLIKPTRSHLERLGDKLALVAIHLSERKSGAAICAKQNTQEPFEQLNT